MNLSTPNVLTLTGCDEAQLCRWCQAGLVPGKGRLGSGHRRHWTWRHVRHLRALRLIYESNPHLGYRRLLDVASLLDHADWSRPLAVNVTPHVVMLVDLPGISDATPDVPRWVP